MKAYELLDSKDKWTQLAYARNKNNIACDIDDINAVKFCLVGAIARCYPVLEYIGLPYAGTPKEYNNVQRYLQDIEKTGEYPHAWNDRHTYEEVIALLKKLDI